MIELAQNIIGTQPILAVFLAIGVGYLVGQVNIFGFSLGVGAVLFVGLAIAVIAGLAVAIGLGHLFGIQIGHTLGMYAGSMTSTATLQAALDVMGNKDPSIGYSIAYPFGVIGPILCIYFMTRHVKPKFPAKAQRFHMGEITLGSGGAGRTLEDVGKDLPAGVQVTMVRKGDQSFVP